MIKHETGLSSGTGSKITQAELCILKVSVHWGPRFLTLLLRQTWRDLLRQMLTLLEQDEEDFFGRLVTMDESWIYLYDPETKEMSKEWKHTTSSPTK